MYVYLVSKHIFWHGNPGKGYVSHKTDGKESWLLYLLMCQYGDVNILYIACTMFQCFIITGVDPE